MSDDKKATGSIAAEEKPPMNLEVHPEERSRLEDSSSRPGEAVGQAGESEIVRDHDTGPITLLQMEKNLSADLDSDVHRTHPSAGDAANISAGGLAAHTGGAEYQDHLQSTIPQVDALPDEDIGPEYKDQVRGPPKPSGQGTEKQQIRQGRPKQDPDEEINFKDQVNGPPEPGDGKKAADSPEAEIEPILLDMEGADAADYPTLPAQRRNKVSPPVAMAVHEDIAGPHVVVEVNPPRNLDESHEPTNPGRKGAKWQWPVAIVVVVAVVGGVLGGVISGRSSDEPENFTSLPSVPVRTAFVTTEELREAIMLYFEGNLSSVIKYGDNIQTWDVSGIEIFDSVFSGLPVDLDLNWNTTSAISMASMFDGASIFNGDISGWDVSRVTNMTRMFLYAESFNQPLEGWNVSSVTTMWSMFALANSFNQPLEAWDVSSVATMDWMFYNALSFNQPLEAWDVSSVTTMDSMFEAALSFNQPLEAWNVSSVTTMDSMFALTNSFNQPLEAWNVSSVTTMDRMFSFTNSFNQPLEAWDVRAVTTMGLMFAGAIAFNQNLCVWGTLLPVDANVRNMFGRVSFPASSCPNFTTPVLPLGPFCYNCDNA